MSEEQKQVARALSPAATNGQDERTVLRDLAQALAWQCFGECRGYSERLLSPIDALAAARAVLDSTAAQTTQQAGEATRPVGVAGKMPGTDGFTMACFKAVDVPFGTLLYATPQPAAQAAPAVLTAAALTDLQMAMASIDECRTIFEALRRVTGLLLEAKATLGPENHELRDRIIALTTQGAGDGD